MISGTDDHRKIRELFHDGAEKDDILLTRLETIALKLKETRKHPSPPNHGKKLAGEINILIDLLSPGKPLGAGS